MLARKADPRDAFIDELIAIGRNRADLTVLDADVSRTTRTRRFRDAFPDRFYDVGVAEQNLMAVAAGMASTGRVVVAATLAVFATMRAAEQLRTFVCYPRLNVKVLGGYAGLSNGKDGATHQSIEDVAITRSFPNLVVMSPSDAPMSRAVARAAIAHEGPVYIRLEYEDTPIIHAADIAIEIGRGIRVRVGRDVTLASYGIALARTLAAADSLGARGISAEVLDFATIKPFDADLLVGSVTKTRALVTVEDHNVIGGLASAACDALVRGHCLPRFRALGVQDVFTESGRNDDVRARHGIDTESIIDAALDLVAAAK